MPEPQYLIAAELRNLSPFSLVAVDKKPVIYMKMGHDYWVRVGQGPYREWRNDNDLSLECVEFLSSPIPEDAETQLEDLLWDQGIGSDDGIGTNIVDKITQIFKGNKYNTIF